MKFLCLRCDEGMKLEAASGPREGSLEATFVCPSCHYKVAMLTNPWETQLVQTLGVTIGGRSAPTNPYEQVLGNLGPSESEVHGIQHPEPASAGCPFADIFGQTEQAESTPGVLWTAPAMVRVERIPSFIRPMVQRAIERYAVEQGHPLITDAIMDEARSKLGM